MQRLTRAKLEEELHSLQLWRDTALADGLGSDLHGVELLIALREEPLDLATVLVELCGMGWGVEEVVDSLVKLYRGDAIDVDEGRFSLTDRGRDALTRIQAWLDEPTVTPTKVPLLQ